MIIYASEALWSRQDKLTEVKVCKILRYKLFTAEKRKCHLHLTVLLLFYVER